MPLLAPSLSRTRSRVMQCPPNGHIGGGRLQQDFDPIEEAKRQWDLRWSGGVPMAAATSIMRAQQIMLAAVDAALRPYGLTFARWEALVLLSFTRQGELPLGQDGLPPDGAPDE